MDYFDDIAAIALGPAGPVSLVEAVEAYERDGVKRMIKLWKQYARLCLKILQIDS